MGNDRAGFDRVIAVNNQLKHQLDMDVERLRKAADRIRLLRDAYVETNANLDQCVQSLKIIAIWAGMVRNAEDVQDIRQRAFDTLKLIGRMKS